MIEHDHRRAAGPEHAVRFVNGALGIGRVVQDAVRIEQVKAIVSKRQRFGVGDSQVGG